MRYDRGVREADFQGQVVQLAGLAGWRTMHVRPAIGRRNGQAAWQTTTSVVGWPDLVLWSPRRGRVLFRELKTDAGRLTPQQAQVLDELAAAGADVGVWRPRDFDTIREELR